MRGSYDILWKGILEELFDDFLRFLFPNARELFDLGKKFEFMDKELSEIHPEGEKTPDTRFLDKLVKVHRRDGREEWVLVHVEVQGYYDPEFAKRMFAYYCRIFARHNRPITAIVIFSGQDGKRMPDHYVCKFAGTELIYRYNALYLSDYTDEELTTNKNVFALALLAAKKGLLKGKILDEELINEKLLVLNELYEKGLFSDKKLSAIAVFLNNYVQFEDPETNRIFMERFDKITGKKNSMGVIELLAEIKAEEARKVGLEEGREKGLEEGREKGIAETKKAFVKNLLSVSDFTMDKIASVVGVPLSFVRKVRDGKI